MGQQHLGTGHAFAAQLGLVHLGQPHLTDGSSGLQLMHLGRTRGPAQALHAFGNGAAGDHDDFALDAVFTIHQGRQLAAPLFNGGLIQTSTFIRNQAGADFDDDATGITQHIGRHENLQCFRPLTPMDKAQAAIKFKAKQRTKCAAGLYPLAYSGS